MKIVNLNKSKDILGKKLVRGCQIEKPFYSQVIGGKVGNIRTALTFLSRENVDIELVAKSKLNKAELNKIVVLPKRKISNYDDTLKILLSERIRNDKEVIVELAKYYMEDKKYIAVEFVSEDENGRKFEDMNRYCKILNRLMLDPLFVNIVITAAREKPRHNNINIKNIKDRAVKTLDKFDKARPFVKRENSSSKEKPKRVVEQKAAEKKKVIKNFKKQLPYTKIK